MNPEVIQYLMAAALIGLLSKGFFEWLKSRKNSDGAEKQPKNNNPGRNNYATVKIIDENVKWLKEAQNKVGERSLETNIHLQAILRELQEQRHLLQTKIIRGGEKG